MRLRKMSFALGGLGLFALSALVVAACSSDVEKSDLDSANARIDALQTQNNKAHLLAFTNAVRAEDLHGARRGARRSD